MKFKIRPAEVTDHHFVIETWVEHYKIYSQFGKSVPGKVYFPNHRRLIKICLENYECYVACDQEDESLILGFICAGQCHLGLVDALHFIFVRQAIRKQGIGKALIDHIKKSPAVMFTHQGDLRSLWSVYESKLYNPYIFMGLQ